MIYVGKNGLFLRFVASFGGYRCVYPLTSFTVLVELVQTASWLHAATFAPVESGISVKPRLKRCRLLGFNVITYRRFLPFPYLVPIGFLLLGTQLVPACHVKRHVFIIMHPRLLDVGVLV